MEKTDKSKGTLIGAIDADVLAFTAGRDTVLDRALIKWDCVGTMAHVATLRRLESPVLFSAEEEEAIRSELQQIVRDAEVGEFEITLEDQDVHLAVERRLTAKLGDIGKRVHTGRSRNDQVAVDIRLHMRDELIGIFAEICALSRSLLALASSPHGGVPMVGRTHLQPAMPSSVGLWASAWAEGFLDDVPALEAAWKVVDRCPLGSAAGYGVPLALDRKFTADALGFSAPIHNVFAASNARGKCEAVLLGALAQIMITASRLAEDLILFSMPEFAYFKLPKELCTGSSIMPQKYNPDVLELIRAKAARVLGAQNAASALVVAMPGGYNRDLQESKELYMEGLATTRSTLRILVKMIEGLTVDEARLRAGFGAGVFATDRALELVLGGMPFRAAYKQVREHLEDLQSMDPDEVIARKTSLGNTGNLNLAVLYERAAEVERAAEERFEHIKRAFDALRFDVCTQFPRY